MTTESNKIISSYKNNCYRLWLLNQIKSYLVTRIIVTDYDYWIKSNHIITRIIVTDYDYWIKQNHI